MSVYSVKGKGWRFDFTHKGTRHTGSWFQTKRDANLAEARKREEVNNPQMEAETRPDPTGTDITFLDLVNLRLDHVKAYNSKRHYTDYSYMARRWVREWKRFSCGTVNTDMIRKFLIKRLNETSAFTANKELRYLRALFNFAMHPSRDWIKANPTRGIEFFPTEKRIKYVPSKKDILRVLMAADPETQDYLWTIALTIGRMGEVNRLCWQDIDFDKRNVTLYTRKKKGGHLTPRKIPMTDKLFEILSRRFSRRDQSKPWVFWHRYWSRKNGHWVEGPYADRKKVMTTLCNKAEVKYFRFHALRHFGATMLDAANIPIGSIQRILGHENRTTTEIYLHSVGEGERNAMGVLEMGFCEKSHTESHTKIKKV
ncbi:MAG: tyrosine-type recombinase/integrase [Thermodesulfobacteriota bacterium]